MSSFNKNGNSRILLVDDEPDICLVFKTVLKDEGFKVDSFEDPQLALSHLKPDFYDLVVLDIKMPGMNGFQLYKELRKIDAGIILIVLFGTTPTPEFIFEAISYRCILCYVIYAFFFFFSKFYLVLF